MNLEAVWEDVKGQTYPNAPGSVRRRLKPESPCDVYLGVELPSRLPMLVLTVPTAVAKSLQEEPASAGIVTSLLQVPEGKTDVCMKLVDPKFADMFYRLVEDIVEKVTQALTAEAGIQIFVDRFLRWQRFLQRLSPEGLSYTAQLGLYGELWFLRRHLFPLLDSLAAVTTWTGPTGANQDFQYVGLAIEVKCTSTKLPLRIRVQSERQLDAAGIQVLYLAAFTFDIREGSEQTLPELVASIRKDLSENGSAANLFEDRLYLAGYLEAHRDQYQHRSFAIREEHLFLVKGNFPRIVESDLKPGVGDVAYSVGISDCLTYEVQSKNLADELKLRKTA